MNIFEILVSNQPLIAGFLAWFIAQLLKMLLALKHGFTGDAMKRLVSSGGFPSSHSSAVTALAASCGLNYGFASPFFAISAVFALVVIYDAFTLRREAGLHAEAINKIFDDFYRYKTLKVEQMRELLGHTRFEVFFGFLLGAAIAWVIFIS